MFCFKCGKQIPDDSEYCLFCGVKIAKIDSGNEHISEGSNTSSSSPNTAVGEINDINYQTYNNFPGLVSGHQLAKIGRKVGKKILYAIACLVLFLIGCMAIGVMIISIKSYDFKIDKLSVHTYKGFNTTLTMQGPFDIKMQKGDTNLQVENLIGGRNEEKNFMQDVFAVKYNVDIDNNKLEGILSKMIYMYNGARFLITDGPVFKNGIMLPASAELKKQKISGLQAVTTEIIAFDAHLKNKRTLKYIVVSKNNEVWAICLGYPSDSERAVKFITQMVDSIDIK